MRAEQRLDENNIHRIDNTSRGPEIGACGPYDLAREAIALLRELGRWDVSHAYKCPSYATAEVECNCGLEEWEKKYYLLLDGEYHDGKAEGR